MTKIYEQHDKSFPLVSAYAIMKGKNPVAKIAFKYPQDGAGRLYVYIHWVGIEMVRGQASGYGYDKHTAACNNAAVGMPPLSDECYSDGSPCFKPAEKKAYNKFRKVLSMDNGYYWDQHLRDAGFRVFGVV